MNNHIQLEITETQPFAGGIAFGETGSYERIKGIAHYSVDPTAPAQAGITDLHNAFQNSDGLVEFSADFMILRPVNASQSNRRIFYDWGNRGNIRSLQFFNDAIGSNDPIKPKHAGNGFLFRRGYTIVFSAWQGDLLRSEERV